MRVDCERHTIYSESETARTDSTDIDAKYLFTKSKRWQVLRFICLLFFLGGCLFQSGSFFQIYLEYPTIVELQLVNAPTVSFPGVTVCNNNKIRKTAWCETDPEVCGNTFNGTSQEYKVKLSEKFYHLSREERIKLGIKKIDFILKCEYMERNCLKYIAQFFDHDFSNCFTFNPSWGPEGHVQDARVFNPVTGNSTELTLWINLDASNYSPLDKSIRAKMTIHTPESIPNPAYDAVNLQRGQYYKYGVRETVVNLLPAPYNTNCREYRNEKEWRTGGTLTQESCLAQCFWEKMTSTCKCTYHRLSILYGGPVCGEDKLTSDCVQRALTEANDRCYSSCRMQCFKKTYDYVAVHSTTIPFEEKNLDENEISILKSTFSNISEMRDNLIRLTVYYGSTERSVLSHRPKYEPIEVFSVIGGYTGFWLGVSFVAFLEWIERFLSRVSRKLRLKKRTSELTHLSVFPWKEQSRGVVSPRFSDRSIDSGMRKQLPFKFNRNVWFD